MTSRLLTVLLCVLALPVTADEKEGRWTLYAPRPIEFVAEKTGPFEQEVKEALVPLLRHHTALRRAYLVSVVYGGKEHSVALCLESDAAPDVQIIAEVSEIFRKKAGRDTYLDVIFLQEEQRALVRQIAQAFYVAS